MAYIGQPVPSTVYNATRAKVSDGKSVKVTVPENTTIEAGKFYLLGGFFGVAMQSVTTGAGETAEVILNIEEAEYETDQTNDTQTYAVGTPLFWNDTLKRFTETATGNRFVGIVTSAKDANGVIWFKLSAQANPMVQGAAVADITTDMSADVNDNELKNKINELLASLRAAGIIAS